MGSTNQSPKFKQAKGKFLNAKSDKEKSIYLKEMIKECPKHKSSEKMLANLRTRYKKLKEKLEKTGKKGKRGKKGIKKAELQAAIIGLTNSGKSCLLSILTNSKPEISPIQFTTKKINIGTLDYEGVKIQIIDEPAVESEYFDQGTANTADLLIIVITKPSDIKQILVFLEKAKGEKLIILNKIDLLSADEKRKFLANLQSKKYKNTAISCRSLEGINKLKEKIFQSFDIIRIYTKEPRKEPSKKPIILPKNSTISEVAEKIHAGLSKNIKETKVTGPSSKFPNQHVGLSHIVKDRDIVEFHFK